jgi:hypothetical protein
MPPSDYRAIMTGDRSRTTLRLTEQDLEWRENEDEIVVLDGRNAAYLARLGLWHPDADRARGEH